jgi:hypothetical protein
MQTIESQLRDKELQSSAAQHASTQSYTMEIGFIVKKKLNIGIVILAL